MHGVRQRVLFLGALNLLVVGHPLRDFVRQVRYQFGTEPPHVVYSVAHSREAGQSVANPTDNVVRTHRG